MSNAAVEVVPVGDLEGLLESVPPCAVYIGGLRCGMSAEARVTVTCDPCGKAAVFLCAYCLGWLRRDVLRCMHCLRVIASWSWL